MRFIYSSAIFLFLLLASSAAYAQASVNENATSSIYVDAASGSDQNIDAQSSAGVSRGSVKAPFKTLQAAINLAAAGSSRGVATKVVVNPGVYRETVKIPGASSQAAPLIIEAASVGTAVLAGSDVVTNWNTESSSPAIYSHSWTYNFGNCAIPSGWPTNFAPIARRSELVFVNGVPMTEVMTYGELRPGTFYVNEGSNVMDIAPPPGTNMSSAKVETAVRRQILNISGRSNVVLRGMVLEHAATCINQSGSVISSSSNVLVDKVQAVWNNWGGLEIDNSRNVTVQNSIASHNGGVGFQGNQLTNARYNYNESDYNNWRGAQGALYDWGMGGIKLMLTRSATINDHYSYRNQAQGIWFDTDNQNAVISNSTSSQNVLAAVQLERNEGPVTLENSKLCSSGLGVNVLTVEKLSIKNNLFYNNSGTNNGEAAIFIAGTPGGQRITNWQTGQSYELFTTGMALDGNTIADASGGQYVFATYLSGSDWSKFADSLNAGTNRWYDPYNANAFKVENGKAVNLSGWRSAVGTDYSSNWGAPSGSSAGSCSVSNPSPTDFSVNVNNRSFTMSGGQTQIAARVSSFGYGTVNLAVSGLPAGVSASLSSYSLVSGNVTVTLRAAKGAANKTVPITLTAYGSNRVHNATFYVHVIP